MLRPHRTPVTRHYLTVLPRGIGDPVIFDRRNVRLDCDGVVVIVTDEYDEIVEWFTEDTPLDTARNFSTGRVQLHYMERMRNHPVVAAAVQSNVEWNDCFAA